jgi:hypothetical protein
MDEIKECKSIATQCQKAIAPLDLPYDCLLQRNGSFSLVGLYMKMAFTCSGCDRNAFLLTNKQAEKARVSVHSSVHLFNGIC